MQSGGAEADIAAKLNDRGVSLDGVLQWWITEPVVAETVCSPSFDEGATLRFRGGSDEGSFAIAEGREK